MLRQAPDWVKDLSWEELDMFFVQVFAEVDKRHLEKHGFRATTNSIYDYASTRWVDR